MGERAKLVCAFCAVFLIWGTTYLAIGNAVTSIPPVFMVVTRSLIAGALLYWWTRRRGAKAVTGREMVAMLPTAALLFGGGYVLVGWAEQQVPSGSAALLNATTPAWVVMFEWLRRRRARPDLRFAGSLVLGVAGVAVLVGADATLPLLPSLALVGASIAWGLGTVRARESAHGDPTRDAAVQLLTGGALLLPVSVALGEPAVVLQGIPFEALSALTYLTLVGSVIAYSAYVWLLHHVPASKVSSHSYVNPLIAVLVGAVFAHETVGPGTLVAGALILLSVFFIVSEPASRAARSPETLQRSPRPRIAA